MIKFILNLVARCRRYRAAWVEDLPENVARQTVYIIGGRKHPFYAAVICPRRTCRQVIHLDLSPQADKPWRLVEHTNGSISLAPSIHVTAMPCRCHYWLKHGRIIWAERPSLLVPKENRCYAR